MATSFSIDRILSTPSAKPMGPSKPIHTIPRDPQGRPVSPASFPPGLNPTSFYSVTNPQPLYPSHPMGSPQGSFHEVRSPSLQAEDSVKPNGIASNSLGGTDTAKDPPKSTGQHEDVSWSDGRRSTKGLSIARPVPRRASRSADARPLGLVPEDPEDLKLCPCSTPYTPLTPPSPVLPYPQVKNAGDNFRNATSSGVVTSLPITVVSAGPLGGGSVGIDEMSPRTAGANMLGPGAMSAGVIGQRTSCVGAVGLGTVGPGAMSTRGVPAGVNGPEVGVMGIPGGGSSVMNQETMGGARVMTSGSLGTGALSSGVMGASIYKQFLFHQFLEAQYRMTPPLPFPYYPLFDYSAFPSPRRLPRRGGQIRFTGDQTKELEAVFDQHKYITPSRRKDLARDIHLDEKQVKTWFQNRRAKWRKTRVLRGENTVIEEEEERKRYLGEESGDDEDSESNESNTSTRA